MTQDENAIIFRNKREENYAKEIKRYIENYKHSINLSNEVAIDDGIAKNQSDPLERIKKLKELLDIEAITQEEFDAKKKELLNL
ncbi:SHOCT domain-containing protein [Clostridioides difficile]|uniref:SHOCT domain-containing protein n=3 Tax=Peptostreptococcaceae TaxID=186804 RepID=UPI00235942FB|nr:SHOCT domain-containing protein [Clostridioides difficile]MDC9294414.1 SHOCT domain-containing protein [Clostridioides difficile]